MQLDMISSMRNSTIVCLVKMESVSKITILGITIMVKMVFWNPSMRKIIFSYFVSGICQWRIVLANSQKFHQLVLGEAAEVRGRLNWSKSKIYQFNLNSLQSFFSVYISSIVREANHFLTKVLCDKQFSFFGLKINLEPLNYVGIS